MKKIMIYSLPILMFMAACKKEDKLAQAKEKIIGKWQQIEPYCCDTFVFQSDGRLILHYGESYTYSYEILREDSILINNHNGARVLYYEFNHTRTALLIKEYYPSHFWGDEAEDALLKKIK